MKTTCRFMIVATVLIGLSGCASNPIVGHGTVQAGRYAGEVGIAGNGSALTIQTGSEVSKLSIVGDGSRVIVEDGARVRKIEFWGNGNTVSIPDDLQVMIAAMGTNTVTRRPTSVEPDASNAPADPSTTPK